MKQAIAIITTVAVMLLACSCADPLRGKPPYWYNGYVYGTRAAGFFAEGKLTSALAFYKKGLDQAEAHDLPEQAAQYRFNAGRCMLELDESDSAFAWYKRGVITPRTTADKTFWLMVHGRLVWARDHSKEALAYLDEAYDLYKKKKAWHGAVEACFRRAIVYSYFGEYDEAAGLLDEALALGDKTPLRFDRRRILLAASAVSSCRKDEEKAQWFYGRAAKSMAEGKKVPPEDSVAACRQEIPW